MRLNFPVVEKRLQRFATFDRKKLSDSRDQDPKREFNRLVEYCSNLEPEEKLFYVLLSTHFDNQTTAQALYEELTWTCLQKCHKTRLMKTCENFFKLHHIIGDHRRNFRCLTSERNRISKAQYTADLLISYRKIVKEHECQTSFFEVGKNVDFAVLFKRMAQLRYFGGRLPRWDHIERLSYTHNYYVVPDRLYLEEPSYSGPIAGMIYLLLGERNKADKNAKKYISVTLPKQWNFQVDAAHQIPPDAKFKTIIPIVERWFIDRLKKLILPTEQRKTFMYDIESCLCQWQKGIVD